MRACIRRGHEVSLEQRCQRDHEPFSRCWGQGDRYLHFLYKLFCTTQLSTSHEGIDHSAIGVSSRNHVQLSDLLPLLQSITEILVFRSTSDALVERNDVLLLGFELLLFLRLIDCLPRTCVCIHSTVANLHNTRRAARKAVRLI